jgi:prolyl-tRNA editing enzyme YbaK/EbsC (Cys-tRNA(Pro) deacylase)
MLGRVVDYLRSNGVAFQLMSQPSPEPEPAVARKLGPPGTITIDTRILLVDGRLAIGCVLQGEELDHPGLRSDLGAKIVQDGTSTDLPWPFEQAGLPIPPLGRLFGAAVFVDARVAAAPWISFAAFSATDMVELIFDDFARLEQPRVMALAIAGELPPPPLR